jgi:heme oxygenase
MNEASVMDRLRTGTADLHRSAEGQAFQRRLASAELSREAYIAWLVQMLHVHRALERPLAERMGRDPRFAALHPEQLQEPYLLADLSALGVDGEHPPAPLPATAACVARMARCADEAPLDLLGFHYVLEGSNNGNRFLARRLVPALGLQRGGGRYLDPYGEEQPLKWAAFKATMNEQPFGRDDMDRLVAAAREMFAAIGAISAELEERLGE